MINYDVYKMDRQEKSKYILMSAAVLFTVGLIFFSNIFIASLFMIGSVWYPKYRATVLIQKRKAELNLQFKDALYSLSSSLSAGKSLEGAFKEALNDLKILYPDGSTYIIEEFEYIVRKLEINEPIETALDDFATRSSLESIRNFADVITICKRTGGNMVEVMKNTSNIITDKLEISHDIDLLLTKQKYEQKLLNIMPVVFIGLIKFGGSGYMDSLYTSLKGYILMAISLTILVASYIVSKKIFDIKV